MAVVLLLLVMHDGPHWLLLGNIKNDNLGL